jgi:ribosomal-protein-alanine N-acetyltransferase
MRQYKMQEKKEVDKIVCNKCGKEILVENGVAEADMLSVQKRWGYFSNKDNDVHEFDLCEECYDKWIATFAIPIERK